MDNNLLLTLKKEVSTLCVSVADFIKNEINKVSLSDIETKELNSLVSYVDKEAEIRLVKKLKSLLPQAGFITEENTVKQESKPLVWVIDPLDGTTNYLHKIPHFSISIALMEKDQPVFGIVYDIMLSNAYTAIKGLGTWENDKRVKVKPTQSLKEAIVVTGFPYERDNNIDENLKVLKYCILNCRGIRRLGSAALDLAYVASGKLDIYYEKTLNIWDIAAGALLVTEAGGVVSGFSNNESHLETGSIIAGNAKLQPEIAAVIQKHLL